MGVCVLWGWGFWLQEGNDILVTENLLSINLLRRITMIGLCKKNLLFTNNWIRSCVTIVIKVTSYVWDRVGGGQKGKSILL